MGISVFRDYQGKSQALPAFPEGIANLQDSSPYVLGVDTAAERERRAEKRRVLRQQALLAREDALLNLPDPAAVVRQLRAEREDQLLDAVGQLTWSRGQK